MDELPSHIQAPKGPAGCGCDDHLEKMEYEANLPISAKKLFELLFSEEKTGAAANGGIWNQKTLASGSRGKINAVDDRINSDYWFNDVFFKKKILLTVNNFILR